MTTPAADPRLAAAAVALNRGDAAAAHKTLAAVLAEQPAEPQALRLMSELLSRSGRWQEAATRLQQALVVAPELDAARYNLALVLLKLAQSAPARAEIETLLARNPGHPGYRNLHAAVLSRLGDYDAAVAAYQALLADDPRQADVATSLGNTLKTLGRTADAVAAFRHAVSVVPTMGEAWWSLANLKTLRFDDADVAAMQAALAVPNLSDEARLHLDFALGKAFEDRADYAASFRHYAAANALRRRQLDWDGEANHQHRLANQRLFTADFFAQRQGQGCPAPDPIFIVGLPRSGSTLIEQILGSHSQVEGTMELPDIGVLARGLAEKSRGTAGFGYLGALAACSPDELRRLGETYLERTRVQRKTGKPRFIDKLPNNFAYTALIHLALPNAIIIDARRDAMATCFSAWKQHFARGQAYSYDLVELARFYRDYEQLMAHFDTVLPGRILRVQHETLVTDTENEIRRILAHCGLAFEPGCLAFHENRRPVRTPSAEQVRRPITAAGLEQWKHYAPWLRDLETALAGG